jgi:hypothetical protein
MVPYFEGGVNYIVWTESVRENICSEVVEASQHITVPHNEEHRDAY